MEIIKHSDQERPEARRRDHSFCSTRARTVASSSQQASYSELQWKLIFRSRMSRSRTLCIPQLSGLPGLTAPGMSSVSGLPAPTISCMASVSGLPAPTASRMPQVSAYKRLQCRYAFGVGLQWSAPQRSFFRFKLETAAAPKYARVLVRKMLLRRS